MRLYKSMFVVFATGASLVAAASWGFEDATLTVQGKGAGVGGGLKEKLSPSSPLSKAVTLGVADTLKIILTTTESQTGKRPHLTLLTLTETSTGLEESFPFSVKETGKGKVEITQKDLPYQILTSASPLHATIVIASFGSSAPFKTQLFSLTIALDPSAPLSIPEPPLRYGSREHITHTFRPPPRSPPTVISLVFTAAVLVTLPVLIVAWLTLGANVSHLGQAMKAAPISHVLFFGSLCMIEGVFGMYYTSWNLGQVLPVAGAVGVIAFLAGSRALSEVQERRLAGQR
ncbi:hypothetical protein LTR28_000375 [Elasticomyces elasticus]|nr:hypothetical protein LTR28_000375 [Elasticomyces elasticus]